MAWQKGPLPPGTYNWGGVVPTSGAGDGFYFADFKGDHVEIVDTDRTTPHAVWSLKPDEVAWFDNSIELPPLPGMKGRATG